MQRKEQGFTLIELMITIAVLAIITTWALPSFGNLVARQKINAATRELIVAVNQAKSQAATMKTTVALCLNKTNTDNDFDKQKCAEAAIPEYTTTTGTPPIAVLTDDQKKEVLKTRVISVPVDKKITVSSTSSAAILFNEVGIATSTATFNICKSPFMKTVTVTRLGNISQTSGTC
ncbi:Tfp pilus assembly protein FimT/FimU [Acinetobacter sp.]|uniref:pilus assembly FimT family protein n=1 Tax=Acinetobacter sp. TaxID=472 RepID=UPI0026489600|nr:GspH/FimT family pseudopilin [Acinetobacter sp.]MDN5511405.1 GspH/FimT family pseudopilin [Acinetobacter sp.]MDN5524053.1 GspH/FimT family pseudopilin [Acinetobacter sp.]